ncbi:Uracil-DNA glycosylase, family 1 [Pseudonocardia sp. Ae168_Ps1]|uniref:uracil-DNA glycosylase n=1 Tax=unclassified Pseudonocardia TaxID=2619320 RepID=UPI00094B007A|nr:MULTISPECIES: uracil-DNA glycosylase [unclassified Pseudonocardia]OLL76388.1 Uracil-DNA glycosylase, family 1 [Pseudonocardia sp. Ae150A_Ps1]OLL82398.1 Uracil-DNA glycosylase, family 1 [Pseudonocardia sp. Ae168_Ps1]OLL83487.1 Uracil-DNA glycosylase, family 1 [Pseudonocardia sp. Ae263_Ps1]OLL90474.1 Uracil-DNA glycosylase, family 1 [Pseudonocardia sp. Ae356_Ps1]
MAAKPMHEVVEAGWAEALAPVAETVSSMGEFLRAEIAAGRRYLPAGANVLRAFQQPFEDVRVLIVGQDPYPTPGHAVGLSFSVAEETRPLPRSLQNIFREYTEDLGHPAPSSGDLTPWTDQGVLLLNRCLTVAPGEPGSHRNKGWEEVTEQAIRALVARDAEPMVAILWGRDARNLVPLLEDVPLVESAHPSPMSADRGFFGSRPFSRANDLLEEIGGDPVDWKLP